MRSSQLLLTRCAEYSFGMQKMGSSIEEVVDSDRGFAVSSSDETGEDSCRGLAVGSSDEAVEDSCPGCIAYFFVTARNREIYRSAFGQCGQSRKMPAAGTKS
ncbi:hypothetical protein CYMTET_20423 [Cymbomonas tetramitiformis]|uniref:Uncharacterized protein n=1 Tax=Cymbomonas tetramitiformis TaxID=36881 RepID=A0AAE0L490_9CHLO|nr:hypothetical protein CYMTET_20423 [Cymbomonas tetramitiformis]